MMFALPRLISLAAAFCLSSAAFAQAAPTPVVAASTTTSPPTNASAATAAASPTQAKCQSITADAPLVEGVKPSVLCPAIATLAQVFATINPDNYSNRLSYADTSDFYAALASSMQHYNHSQYRSELPITVTVAPTMMTMDSLNTLDEANQYKRNKLGIILERIQNDKGKTGKVCLVSTVKVIPVALVTWLGSELLQYGLPALIKLIAGDPSKIINKYDALVYVEPGSGPMTQWSISQVDFYPRGKLPDVKCNA
jgi:hypothetical protein